MTGWNEPDEWDVNDADRNRDEWTEAAAVDAGLSRDCWDLRHDWCDACECPCHIEVQVITVRTAGRYL